MLYARVFVRIFQQNQNVTRKMTFVRNICTYNVDEINTRAVVKIGLSTKPYHRNKAMRKTGFSGFLCFAKDETDLFS